MPDIYINEKTGERYEVTPNNMTGNSTELVIKPVQKLRGTKDFRLYFASLRSDESYMFDSRYHFTESQGEAVATAIRALMEYINNPDEEKPNGERYMNLMAIKAAEARTAMQAGGGK